MNRLIAKCFLLFTTFALISCSATGLAEVESHKDRFGGHRAVTAFSSDDGFKLSERARKALNVQFLKIKGRERERDQFSIPRSALVHLKATTGVYRRFDGWIAYVLVDVLSRKGANLTVRSSDLQDGDEIAISGVDFLRMTEVDLTTDTVAGCAH